MCPFFIILSLAESIHHNCINNIVGGQCEGLKMKKKISGETEKTLPLPVHGMIHNSVGMLGHISDK